jgi:iron complex outermembrane recepter protein
MCNVNAKLATAIAVALAGTAGIPVASAEQSGAAVAGGLEEIVVTARKREESLQDIPLAVSALSPEELARRPDVDLSSFANASPNVIIDDMQEGPGSAAAMTIRGIGTNDHERSIDPTVGVVVDGVFIGSVGGAMVKALDLHSVEILRGPQGTLFGRNSIGGAVNIVRRKPDSELGGEVRANYGKYNDWQVDGYISVPVGDNFAFKLGGAWNERDGYAYNRTLGKDQGELKYQMISPSFVWQPMDDLEVYYRYDQTWTEQDASVLLNVAQADQAWCFFYNQCAPSLNTPQGGDRYVSLQNNPDPNAQFDTKTHTVNVRYDLSDDYRIDYIFGYFATDEDAYWDYDGTPLTLYDTLRDQWYNQRSHELRMTYQGDSAFTYTVGLYAWDSGYQNDMLSYIGFGDLLFGLPSGTVLTVPQTVRQDTESYAAFFEGDLKFGQDWTLTLGGRYTRDSKETRVRDPLFQSDLDQYGGFSNPADESWSEFTPKVALRYRFSDDLMGYALYTRGFRAGGFSGRPGTYEAAVIPYDPETVDNFELGVKSEWFERRLRMNATLYFMKYNDKQEELSVPVDIEGGTGQQTLFVNASKAELKGLELEVTALPFDGFMISGSLGLLDAEYTDFNDPVTGRSLTSLDLRRAPDMTLTVSPSYEWSVLNGTMVAQADWHYVSEYENTFWNTPQAANDAQDVLDATLSYRFSNTEVGVYGRNLTGADGYTVGLDVGRSLDFAGLWTFTGVRPPRTYGIRITQKF